MPRNGVYDELTQNAVLAYRKVRGWVRIFTLDSGVIRGLLDGVGTFQIRYPKQGRHVEADLTDQTLALINGSKVFAIYPISSGKPSTPTVLGTYHVYLRTPGYLPDGMYYSSFFTGGYAIHGYDPSPTYPASHGCLRLPIDDAIQVYNWVTYGTPVDVYYGATERPPVSRVSSVSRETPRVPREIAEADAVDQEREDHRDAVLHPGAARLDDRREGRGQLPCGADDEAPRLSLLRRGRGGRAGGRAHDLVRLHLRGSGDLISREHHEGCDNETATHEGDQDDGAMDHTERIGRGRG